MARENPSWGEGDFFTSVTATFQGLYVFVAIEIGSRRCRSDRLR
jgi:hypothetical protein